MKIKTQVFNPYNVGPGCLSVGRPVGRPTCTKCARSLGWEAGRSGRSTARELCSLEKPTVDRVDRPGRESALCFRTVNRAVDRPESSCSLNLARSTGRSTGGLNGHFFDRWPVDRSVDRKGILALFQLPTGRFQRGYKYPI